MSKKRIVGIVFASIGGAFFFNACLHYFFSSVISNSFFSFLEKMSGGHWIFWGILFGVIGVALIVRGKTVVYQPPADIAIQLKAQLPPSATPLTDKNVKKIHQLFPVPNDYEIIWAEIQSFGNHPAGVVITNEALILKAPKAEIRKQNKEIKKQNKGKKKEDKKAKIPYVYRIIPWQYFSPDEYQLVSDGVDKKRSYRLVVDETTAFRFETPELFSSFQSIQQRYAEVQSTLENVEVASVNAAINTISVQPALYSAKNGAANTNTGHGILFEDAGSILDKINGERSTVVGRDNAKNGPDKYVKIDGVQTPVQCKCYSSAKESVNACFGKDGRLEYLDPNGNPMIIEVPKDQYLEAIEEMAQRIKDGQVPRVSDPQKAYDIIREGRITYEQAKNLAKSGTIESITYDAATASVRCLSVFGISFIVVLAQVFWETKDIKQATKSALVTGAKIYGLSIIGSVISSQLARAGIENLFYPMMKNLLDSLPDSFVERMGTATKGVVNPDVAKVDTVRNYYARFMAAQASATCIMFLVFSAPDIYKVISNNMSTGQFAMNMAERFAGTVASSASGIVVGSLVGNATNPFLGGIAGFAAGTIGGAGASYLTRKVTHLFREDDSVIVSRLFTAVLINTSMDYMLSQPEQKCLITLLEQDKKGLKRLQKKLIKSQSQAGDIKKYLAPKIKTAIGGRTTIKMIDEKSIQRDADEIIAKGDFCYEV